MFVEKTHGDTMLPHLSLVRSVQAISGSLIKGPLAGRALNGITKGAKDQMEKGGEDPYLQVFPTHLNLSPGKEVHLGNP